jgi:hypothetical protein
MCIGNEFNPATRMDVAVRIRPKRILDENGRELVSRSPWVFLDRCATPAERQAAIYRHQHKTRDAHFRDQDRAEELSAAYAWVDKDREFWRREAHNWRFQGLADAGRAFMRGAALGLLGTVALVATIVGLFH